MNEKDIRKLSDFMLIYYQQQINDYIKKDIYKEEFKKMIQKKKEV